MELSRQIEDRMAIQQLNHSYAVNIDLRELDDWVALFTADAIFDERAFDSPLSVGHDAIRRYGQNLLDIVEHAVHHMTTHLIRNLTETNATGIAFASVDGLLKDGTYTRDQVIYQDRYQKVDGKWLIAERVLAKTLPTEIMSGK